jgi:hypothetical protein
LGRIGRSDAAKWHPASETLVHRLLETLPGAAWTSVGFPSELGLDRLRARWGPRFANFDETSDSDRLTRILASLDLQVFFSRFGECFAFSICEAASVAVPTVALCTPSRDNGQSEQVLDDISGYLVSNPDQAAAAILPLATDPLRLARLKQTTFHLNQQRSSAEVVLPRILDFYEYARSVGQGPTPGFFREVVGEHREFAAAYRGRIARTMSRHPLSRWRWHLQLAAQENHALFRTAREIRRLLSPVAAESPSFT